MQTSVYSLAISGRFTLDMHSLNNEGGEGNQTTTRMVNIVHNDPESGKPRIASVNAISGDMLKHILSEHLYRRAKTDDLPLCDGCQIFSASRAMDDERFLAGNLPNTDAEAIDLLVSTCMIDDIAGNLIAPKGGRRTIPRKSVAEFGWVVGLPIVTRTESYFHVRYAAERGNDEENTEPSEEQQEQSQQVEQPIFHRPASSGIYATVASFEFARIGFNDITQQYTLDVGARKRRYTALLESILYTFVEPNGAMRGTQNPHILGFEGALAISNQVVPAPTLSPLEDNYIKELKKVAGALNNARREAITIHEFNTMGDFAEIMSNLIANTSPYTLFA